MANNIEDKTVRRGHFIERYKTGTANDYDEYLRRVDKLVREILTASSRISSTKQLFSIQKKLRAGMLDIYKDWNRKLTDELIDFSQSEINFLLRASGLALTVPSASVLRSAIKSRPFQNRLLSESLSDLTRSEIKLLKNAISQGYYAGDSNAAIITRIRGTKANNYLDGMLSISKNRTTRLVRTAINHTSARAKEALFQANADIVERYKWVSTLDGRTSDICKSLDGKTWKVGNGPLPPAHFNCRSTVIPVL